MMRNFIYLSILISLAAGSALAQDAPSVEIVLSQPGARLGDVVSADVTIRDIQNLGGADIGITVDDQCLRIIERQPGGFLPTTDVEGAFSPLSELNEHDTRLAAALTDRTKHASGSGVFYRVQLEVTCAAGTAALDFSYAKLSTYEDPTAEIIDLISYDMSDGTLNAVGAQLTIVPAGEFTPAPTSTPEVTAEATSAPEATAAPTTAPEVTAEATPAPAAVTGERQEQRLLIAVIIIIGVTGIGIGILFLIGLRRRRRER